MVDPDTLPPKLRALLWRIQRRAVDDVFLGVRAWDPHAEAPAIEALEAAGLIAAAPGDSPPRMGLYRLAPDLPDPPPVSYDFEETLMPPEEDLEAPESSLSAAEGDLAALAAAYRLYPPRRTSKGTLDVATLKKVGRRLAEEGLAASGRLEDAAPRWRRAQSVLEILGLLEEEPVSRTLRVSPALQDLLDRPAHERFQSLAERVIDADLRPLLPPLRAALAQADDQAVDEVIFLDLLAEQHRDILYSPWGQVGVKAYPWLPGEQPRPYDRDGFDAVEARAVEHVLKRLARLGLLRRAPGVFAATDEGRAWAGLAPRVPPPGIVVSPDLAVVVPPGALPPWERHLLERFAPAVRRDVVDQHRLDRRSFRAASAELGEGALLGLLERRAAYGVPPTVRDTLRAWAA
jgi:hypothetical protein